MNLIEISYKEKGIYEYAVYIYKNNEKIHVKKYDEENKLEFNILDFNSEDKYKLIL